MTLSTAINRIRRTAATIPDVGKIPELKIRLGTCIYADDVVDTINLMLGELLNEMENK